MTIADIRNAWNNEENVLIVAYDNDELPDYLNELELETGWGFSAAIKLNSKKVLFDCGWSGSIETNNLRKLNIPTNEFDYVIISHQHWDHMGGLEWIVSENPNAEYYLPSDFSNNLTRELKKRVKNIFKISSAKGPIEIFDDFYVTGDTIGRGPIGEQAAIINGKNMKLLITGCLHPGLKLLYELACKKITPDSIIGGIHGFKDVKYLKSTGIKNLYIGHCTQNKPLFLNLKDYNVHEIHPGFKISL